jgi:hypothetical protein
MVSVSRITILCCVFVLALPFAAIAQSVDDSETEIVSQMFLK